MSNQPMKRFTMTLGCVFLFHSALAQPLNGFDAFVEKTRLEYGVPGVVVAVVKDGEVVFFKGLRRSRGGTSRKG